MVHCRQKLILTGYCTCEQGLQGVDPCQQIQVTMISWQWELDIHLTGSQWEMQEALSQGSGYAVSDGSFKDAASAKALPQNHGSLANGILQDPLKATVPSTANWPVLWEFCTHSPSSPQ